MGHLQPILSHYHPSNMDVCSNSLRRLSSHSCVEAFGMSSYNGQAFQVQKPHGSCSRFQAIISRFPARGRAISGGGERCYDWQRLRATTSWLKSRPITTSGGFSRMLMIWIWIVVLQVCVSVTCTHVFVSVTCIWLYSLNIRVIWVTLGDQFDLRRSPASTTVFPCFSLTLPCSCSRTVAGSGRRPHRAAAGLLVPGRQCSTPTPWEDNALTPYLNILNNLVAYPRRWRPKKIRWYRIVPIFLCKL